VKELKNMNAGIADLFPLNLHSSTNLIIPVLADPSSKSGME